MKNFSIIPFPPRLSTAFFGGGGGGVGGWGGGGVGFGGGWFLWVGWGWWGVGGVATHFLLRAAPRFPPNRERLDLPPGLRGSSCLIQPRFYRANRLGAPFRQAPFSESMNVPALSPFFQPGPFPRLESISVRVFLLSLSLPPVSPLNPNSLL